MTTAEDFERAYQDKLWIDAAKTICARNRLSFQTLRRAGDSEHVVFLVDSNFVIKIYKPLSTGFEREKAALRFVEHKIALPAPEILGEGVVEQFDYLLTTQNRGVLMTREMWLGLEKTEQIEIITQLARGLRELHSHDPRAIEFDWRSFLGRQTETVVEKQRSSGASAVWLEKIPVYLREHLPLLRETARPVFMHGDVHFGNLRLIKNAGKWRISGLFDFADSLKGPPEYEFVAVGVLMMQGQSEVQREFFRAYGYRDQQIDVVLRRRLMLLTILYECSSLRRYALRLRPEAVGYTLDELERNIWSFANK